MAFWSFFFSFFLSFSSFTHTHTHRERESICVCKNRESVCNANVFKVGKERGIGGC
jgi:hypothetical protein